MIPSNVILFWAGTNASIPTGWTRETALDSKYPKAWGTENPNVTGGSNTHTHTSAAHSHTMNSHTHSVSLDLNTDTMTNVDRGTDSSDQAVAAHSHNAAAIGGMSGGSLNSTTVTWGSANNEPPYYSLIFIKPNGGWGALRSGMIALYNGTSVPSGWQYSDGTNGSPDLRNKYIKGAAAGADAGATGGSLTHSHDISHGHTANSHTHTGTSAVNNNENDRRLGGGSPGDYSHNGHTHTITLDAVTVDVNDYSNTSAGSTDTVEPAYKKIGAIYNKGGRARRGMVAAWLGNVSDIPVGWSLCDGTNGTMDLRDKFIKIGNDLTENGNTGGANTHQHSAVSHTHTAKSSHTHTGSTSGGSQSADKNGNDNQGICSSGHTHSISCDSVTATFSTEDITCGSSSNQPAYRTVVYIEFKYEADGGFLMHFM